MRRILQGEERRLRRRLMEDDPEFALHPQVTQYFLTATSDFGVLASDEEWTSLAFYSTNGSKSFVHYFLGEPAFLEEARRFWGLPCQAFLRSGVKPPNQMWRAELHVWPGMVVNHSAYSGVFSRVAPRFEGTVYERD